MSCIFSGVILGKEIKVNIVIILFNMIFVIGLLALIYAVTHNK
jgi:hypothetical protein